VTNFQDDFRAMLARASRHTFGIDRAHMEFETASVYIRIGTRYVAGETVRTVQIASISVEDRRKGTFTRLVQTIRELTDMPIYIENVLDPAFADALIRKGFSVVSKTDFTTDLILEPPTRVSQ